MNFPDEISCKAKFKEYRDHIGVLCSKCGSQAHYWKQAMVLISAEFRLLQEYQKIFITTEQQVEFFLMLSHLTGNDLS